MLIVDLQERLKELVKVRIEAGEMTGSRLAREAGFQQAHISNFLSGRRGLSLEAMDSVLNVLKLQVQDLLPHERTTRAMKALGEDYDDVALVSSAVSMQPDFGREDVKEVLKFKKSFLNRVRPALEGSRAHWVRFVLLKTDAESAEAMHPRLLPGATMLIDRHYTSLAPYRKRDSNMYLVRKQKECVVRHVELQGSQLWLRPANQSFPLDFVAIEKGKSAADYIVGRVAHVSIET